MIALARYHLAQLAHTQRFLIPVLAYLGLLGMLYADAAGPALQSFTITSGALLLITGWLTLAIIDVEDPIQRTVTINHCGSPLRLLLGVVAALAVCGAGLTVVAIGWPVVTNGASYSPQDLAIGGFAHLSCASAGIAFALPCSGLLIRQLGFRMVAASVVLVMILLVRWVPLVNPLLRAMGEARLPGTTALACAAAPLVLVLASPIIVGRILAGPSRDAMP